MDTDKVNISASGETIVHCRSSGTCPQSHDSEDYLAMQGDFVKIKTFQTDTTTSSFRKLLVTTNSHRNLLLCINYKMVFIQVLFLSFPGILQKLPTRRSMLIVQRGSDQTKGLRLQLNGLLYMYTGFRE